MRAALTMRKTTLAVLLAVATFVAACGSNTDRGGSTSANASSNNQTASSNNASTHGTNNGSTGGTNQTTAAPCATLSPPMLNFGTEVIGQTGQATLTLQNCSEGPLTIQSIEVEQPFAVTMPASLTVPVQQSVTFGVSFAPTVQMSYSGAVVVHFDGLDLTTDLKGTGTDQQASCPNAYAQGRVNPQDSPSSYLSPQVGQTITLTGEASRTTDGNPVASYQWSIVGKPDGSTAQLMPSDTIVAPTMNVDLPGMYAVDLTVYDSNGTPSCTSSRVTIHAYYPGIAVKLTWDTPADPDQTDATGADLDLHFMRSGGTWDMTPYDCFWNNATPDWGAAGSANDPELVTEDSDGAGPEMLVLGDPEQTSYHAGVHYYDDHGFGESDATIVVYFDGTPYFQKSGVQLTTKGQFAGPFDIDWPNRVVTDNSTISADFPN